MSHIPVLKDEVIEYLNIKNNGIYYDATFGGGGHSKLILNMNPKQLYATDKDANIKPQYENNLLIFVQSDFVDFLENEKYKDIMFDGILADIGVSSMQLDEGERGFSFSKDAPLDMRMNQNQEKDAYFVVNTYKEEELFKIIREYGEEPFFRRIVHAIIKNRPIETTKQLADVVFKAKGKRKTDKTHPATQTFQAIRIEVNDELNKIEKFLKLALNRLNNHGRLAIITFHSLEDRIVKQSFVEFEKDCICTNKKLPCVCHKTSMGKIVTKKPVIPTDKEISENPRSRSSKLRIFERIVI